MYVGTVEYVWVFESDAQAKTLGRDVILYAVRKQRGWLTKFLFTKPAVFDCSLLYTIKYCDKK